MTDDIEKRLREIEEAERNQHVDSMNGCEFYSTPHTLGTIDFLLSTIRKLLKEREWQPIETASRKEEVVVLTKEQYIFRAYPMNDGKTWSAVNIETGCGEMLIDEYEPTHWRPLDAILLSTERR